MFLKVEVLRVLVPNLDVSLELLEDPSCRDWPRRPMESNLQSPMHYKYKRFKYKKYTNLYIKMMGVKWKNYEYWEYPMTL